SRGTEEASCAAVVPCSSSSSPCSGRSTWGCCTSATTVASNCPTRSRRWTSRYAAPDPVPAAAPRSGLQAVQRLAHPVGDAGGVQAQLRQERLALAVGQELVGDAEADQGGPDSL